MTEADTDTSAGQAGDAAGYADAVDELETILDELDDENIDIDVLGTKVERAAELIQFCRGRIHDAEMKVTEIVADLAELQDSPAAPGSD